MRESLAALVLLAAAGAAAQSLNPGGKLVETKDGIVFQKNTPTPRPTWERADRSAEAGGGLVTIAPSQGPTGPAVVDAAFVTFRGAVVRIEKGAAITILDGRSGKERRVLLAKGAVVPEGIKAGDAVAVRVPLEEGSGARTADRVELQRTPPAVNSKSKFTQAPAPGTR
ncbi:MAG: hypothetical protein ABI768_01865 [Acidobacteriota bacterium]